MAFWSQKCCLSSILATEALPLTYVLLFTGSISVCDQGLLLTPPGTPVLLGATCVSFPAAGNGEIHSEEGVQRPKWGWLCGTGSGEQGLQDVL